MSEEVKKSIRFVRTRVLKDENYHDSAGLLRHFVMFLFLKLLEMHDQDNKRRAEAAGKEYHYLIDPDYHWSKWLPKALGEVIWLDGRRSEPQWSDDELIEFLRDKLLPYLADLSGSKKKAFIANAFSSKYVTPLYTASTTLRNILQAVESIDLTRTPDIISLIYEELLALLKEQKKFFGEFFMPPETVRMMIKLADPQPGCTIYDPACGSGGFLQASYKHIIEKTRDDTEGQAKLPFTRMVGLEQRYIPAMMGTMQRLQDTDIPGEISLADALTDDISSFSKKIQVIITNPPFKRYTQNSSGRLEQQFLKHCLENLTSTGSRCAIILPDGFLSSRQKKDIEVKEELLTRFNLLLVVSLPKGIFRQAPGVKTSMLFFELSNERTTETLYYEIPETDKPAQIIPLVEEHTRHILALWEQWQAYSQGTRSDRPQLPETSWVKPLEFLKGPQGRYDLCPCNPHSEREFNDPPDPVLLLTNLLENQRQLQQIIERLSSSVKEGVHTNG